MGAILRYTIKGSDPKQFFLMNNVTNLSCSESNSFEVGESIQIITLEDSFTCSVSGKIFKDAGGNFIRSTVNCEW